MSFGPERWDYEQKLAFRYGLQDYMHQVFPFDAMLNKDVLEVGCGTGIDLAEFARHGAHATGVDFSPRNVEITKATLYEARVRGYVLEADASDLKDFGNASFDCVYSFGVLHHVPNMRGALSEIARVLRPGGVFMGMVYHKDSLLYAQSILARGVAAGLTPDEAMCRWSERVEGCPYSRAYTMEEWRDVLAPTFRVRLLEPHFPVIDLPAKRKVRFTLADGDAEALGWHLVWHAEKV